MDGYVHRSPPPAAFWFLCRCGQRNSPRRAKPSAWNESLPKNRRVRDPPLRHLRQNTAKSDNGRTLCAPTASQAGHSKTGRPAGAALIHSSLPENNIRKPSHSAAPLTSGSATAHHWPTQKHIPMASRLTAMLNALLQR